MIGVFYQKETLNDILIINITDNEPKKVNTTNEFCIGYNEADEVCFINIFYTSNYIKIPNGFIELNKKIIKLVQKLTDINLKSFDWENKFVYGKVTECNPIPNTHLHKCVVNIGNDNIDVVCGAKNVRLDMVTVVAKNGAILPCGRRINSGKIMNNVSKGMLCSEKELNIPLTTEGIIEITKKVIIGSNFTEFYKGEK